MRTPPANYHVFIIKTVRPNLPSDPRGHRSEQGERQQQEESGEARHGRHPHVRRLLAPHPAHPPAEVCPALPGHHPQHLHTGRNITKYFVTRINIIACYEKPKFLSDCLPVTTVITNAADLQRIKGRMSV